MARYILNRVLSGVLTLFLFVTIMFFVVQIALPGDFVTSLGPMTAEDAADLRQQYGLDRPLYVQYFGWLGSILTLDLGLSFARGPVWEAVREAMAPTLVVLVLGLAIAFILGSWLGRTAGFRGTSLLSGAITFVAVVCLTLFPPSLAVAMEQGILRNAGWSFLGRIGTIDSEDWVTSQLTTSQVLWSTLLVFALTLLALWLIEAVVWRVTRRRIPRWAFLILIVAIPLIIWSRTGLSGRVLDLAGSLSLLIVAVVIITFGEVALVTRAAMDDVMMEDYVMVARAKGLHERHVRDRHAARASLLPVLSRFTVAIPYFLTGLVILEVVFGSSHQGAGIPITGTLMRFSAPTGLGTLLFDSLADQDIPMLIGALLIVGLITLGLRIVLDVMHAGLDPRVRFGDDVNGS